MQSMLTMDIRTTCVHVHSAFFDAHVQMFEGGKQETTALCSRSMAAACIDKADLLACTFLSKPLRYIGRSTHKADIQPHPVSTSAPTSFVTCQHH